MSKKSAFLGLAFLWITALVLRGAVATSAAGQYQHLSSVESEIVSRVNGTSIYNYDLQMEDIALNFYSFRSSGSAGANETAMWIQRQFESFGLDTHNESFELTTWNLKAQPALMIDADGNLSTIDSFQCEHYSWPTPDEGVFDNVVTLPLPPGNSPFYDASTWVATNTTGKVLFMGAEIQWNRNLKSVFWNKLENQTPAAVIFAWSYSSMPPLFSPGAGHDFWGLKIPVGWVSHQDGQSIRAEMDAGKNVSALVSIRAAIEEGPHYNVVAKLPGSVNPEKMIIISGHYDSVVDPAFCDDGSGTAAVIELARVFSEAAQEGLYKPQYTLVFIAFAGGELGLAGSVNYVRQHVSELGNITAVINLDSLGSKTMEISKTFPDDSGLDLQSIVMNAGNNLGVSISLTAPLARISDQEAFRDPMDTDDLYFSMWGTRSGIRNDTRVKSSLMIDSSPLTWIHTENDNSNSTSSLGWVTIDSLEGQTRVAGLSVMRVLSTIFSPFLLELYGSLAIAGAVVAVVAYFQRSRLIAVYRRFTKEVRSDIGLKEVVYIVILTTLFMFASFAFYARVAEIEVVRQGYPRIVPIEYYGTPFEMFDVVTPELGTSGGGTQLVQVQVGSITILWVGLLANFLLFLLSAFVITLAVMKVRYARGL